MQTFAEDKGRETLPLQPRSGFCQLSASKLCNVSWCEGFECRPTTTTRPRAGVTSPDRITRHRDSDGTAETKSVLTAGPPLALRHGPRGKRPLCRRHRCGHALGYTEGAAEIKSSATKWLIYPVVRATISGRRTLLLAQGAMQPRMASTNRMDGRRFGKST